MASDNNSIEIVLPVYNEQDILEENFLKLRKFLEANKLDFVITIIDNNSTDKTPAIAEKLQLNFPKTSLVKLNTKGRGKSLRLRINASNCFAIAYMDIDLSADLNYFLEMHALLCSGYDIVIGSRRVDPSLVNRSAFRKLLTSIYSRLVRTTLNLPFLDYQCGFKIFRREAILPFLPKVKNDTWFFDTEMLFYAYRTGLKIKEIPVMWKDRKYSRVNFLKTIIEDIAEIARLRLSDEQ